MPVYAQHGYGKTDKIETALRQGVISGVVLSPRDETPDRLRAYVTDLRDEFGDGVAILFDPQFYATTVLSARDGNLPDYPYYAPGLTRANFTAPTDLRRYVSDTLGFQAELSLDRLISPAVSISSFADPWSQIALSMGSESLAVHRELAGTPGLLVSIIIDEIALRSREQLSEFLDIVTVWETAGFYVVVVRNDTSYPAPFNEAALANLMYLVYTLGELNNFEIICGYTDLCGLLLHAVGATVTSTGWHNSLRQFSWNRFMPATGGRPPRARYTSASLLNSILVTPELGAAASVGLLNDILSNTSHDRAMRAGTTGAVPWPPAVACLHHWEVLARLAGDLSDQPTITARLSHLEGIVGHALSTYQQLEGRGVPFDVATGPRELRTWRRAIDAFRTEAGV